MRALLGIEALGDAQDLSQVHQANKHPDNDDRTEHEDRVHVSKALENASDELSERHVQLLARP